MIHDHSVCLSIAVKKLILGFNRFVSEGTKIERTTYRLNKTDKAEIVGYDVAFVICVEFVDLLFVSGPRKSHVPIRLLPIVP